MSLPRIVASAAYVVLAIVLGFWGLSVIDTMMTEVNRHLPEDQQFDAVGWHFFKAQRLLREYRRCYPDGTLIRQYRTIQVLGIAGFVTCVLVFSLSGP